MEKGNENKVMAIVEYSGKVMEFLYCLLRMTHKKFR